MSKQFLAIVAAIIILFVGAIVITGNKSDSGSKTTKASALTQHIEGTGSTGVTLVEYGDFQCPYCQVYSSTVKQVAAQYNDQIKFQFRNFPLVNAHRNAFAAARAAEAAAMQNKYWEMHDLLYETNDPNGRSGWVASTDAGTYFNQFAKQLGLNLTKFQADYASRAVNDAINADMAEGAKLQIQGTPTFFLDGKKVEVNNDVASFNKVINAEIAKKSPTTTPAPAATN